MFIDFQENVLPRHAYSSHPVYLFLKLSPPTPFILGAFFSLPEHKIMKKYISLITAIKTSYFVFLLIYSFLIIQTINFEILRLPFLKHGHAAGVFLLAF